MFADHFGIGNILTKSDTSAKTQSVIINIIKSEISSIDLESLTHTKLDDMIDIIEARTGLDLITAGKTKEFKIVEIMEKLGLLI